MTILAWPETATVTPSIVDFTVADVTTAKSETPTDAAIQAAYDARTDKSQDDRIHYTTPEGALIAYEVVGTTVVREDDGPVDYPVVPDANNFNPNTIITVTAGGLRTLYQNNAGGTAFVEGDYEGATGGGGSDGDVESAYDTWAAAQGSPDVDTWISNTAGGASFIANAGTY